MLIRHFGFSIIHLWVFVRVCDGKAREYAIGPIGKPRQIPLRYDVVPDSAEL